MTKRKARISFTKEEWIEFQERLNNLAKRLIYKKKTKSKVYKLFCLIPIWKVEYNSIEER